MSLNLANVDIGAQANDGTGDPIRSAFITVNSNFLDVQTQINNGDIAVINNATTISTNNFEAGVGTINSFTAGTATITDITSSNISTTNITSGVIASTGNINIGGNVNASKDVYITGNLVVHGITTTVSSVDTTISDSLMRLHQANGSPWSIDDGKDIGFAFNYYKGSPKIAALVWANDTGALEYYADGTESVSNTFTGTYGKIKTGSFLAANTTSDAFSTPGGLTSGTVTTGTLTANVSTANVITTGNLTVTNKIVGSLYIGGPGSTDTIYINGVPVATALSSFNGGQVGNLAWFLGGLNANAQIASTSTTTGSLTVEGGVGVTGNIYAGGIRNTPISGSTGDFTTLSVSSTFAASSVSFLGGYISNVHGDATQWTVTDFVSSNVKITGGTITGLGNLASSSVTITGGTITGLTSLGTSSATITGGNLTGLTQVTSTNITSTNGLVVSGSGARIAGDFSNPLVSSRTILQTTTTNGATNISAMPRGTIATTALTASLRVEDTNAIATGNGASGGIELYQDTDVRIQSTVRGTGTYLPLTIYTNGSKNAQFSTNHDVTIYNTSGTGVITLGANGTVMASSFSGAGTGLTGTAASLTAGSANSVAWANVSGRPTNVSTFTNDSGYITSATLGTYGVSQIIAGTNITISPTGGTGTVTINTTATANAALLTGSTLSSNVTASSLTSVGTLSSLTTSGDVTVGGNLLVNGTTTTINATTLDVADLNITVAKNASTAAAANGAGLTVNGAGATFTYTSADDRWNVNKTINGTITNALSAPASDVYAWAKASVKPTYTAIEVAGAKYTESGTAPSSPAAGDRWYNTTSDILYQYIGTSWVDVFTAGVTATSSATANAIAQRDSSGGAAFSTVTAANVYVSGAITTSGVGTVNIGTATNKFGTIYGTATTAQYADLAEMYVSDKDYPPGTVVSFGGSAEITASEDAYDTRIAGVISTKPAYLMNDTCKGLPVALTGRVPCKVFGPVKKGDVLVSSILPGVAQAIENSKWVPGCVIGKALEEVNASTLAIIEVVIGRF